LLSHIRPRHVLLPLAGVLLLLLGAAYGLLRASLPQLDGEIRVNGAGLTAQVLISRDRLGVADIVAATRADLAYATGFAHAQDRFFEMDLSRRLAAGELSELVGSAAISQDRQARRFRFRMLAGQIMAQLPPEQRQMAQAYTRGVNAGLASLSGRPWEYWVLGSRPAPWVPEDSLLVAYAMWWDLQANGFRREILRHELNARIGGGACEAGWKCGLSFLYLQVTAWDAPVDGQAPQPGRAAVVGAPGTLTIPGPAVLDVRGKRVTWAKPPGDPPLPELPDVGSNSWAVAGSHTATGAALIANDMHLGQRVPTIWYRARLAITGKGGEPPLTLNGVTLPGTPLLVAGSNGQIAWGFTNSYGSWLDVTAVPCTAVETERLLTPDGPVPLSVAHEEIRVHHAATVPLAVQSGPSGVLLLAQPERGVCWFGRWLAQVPAAVNLGLMALERAGTADAALALAPLMGIPHQNFVVGDREGHIGWSIAGRIPAGAGADRITGAAGWVEGSASPRIYDPPLGRIWTANAQVTADPRRLAMIGAENASLGAQYDLAARARQIRDDLLALDQPATPADMLRIQLDDRAIFLTRWHDLLVKLLDEDAVKSNPARRQLRELLTPWDGHASPSSVNYRIVRTYREHTERAVWEMLLHALDIPRDDNALVPPRFEEALWQLVNEQPLHMLAPDYHSWRELLLAQADATVTELRKDCGNLERCTWGHGRAVKIRHPLSGALPFLSGFLDMPVVELPGDHNMPRVQVGAMGASERFAVSPGHEAEAYLHIPGGQSGHPLSPYYRAGFEAWAKGEPQPLLPGPAEHQLMLRP
jgi:penicillin amidase